MSDAGFMQLAASLWAPVLVGYGFGLLTGWLLWRAAARGKPAVSDGGDLGMAVEGEAGQSPEVKAADLESAIFEGASSSDQEALAAKLSALEAALADAKARLAESDAENAETDRMIEDMSEAIKRANGRLKLLSLAISPDEDEA